MFHRGPYMTYYENKCKKKIPRSTQHWRRQRCKLVAQELASRYGEMDTNVQRNSNDYAINDDYSFKNTDVNEHNFAFDKPNVFGNIDKESSQDEVKKSNSLKNKEDEYMKEKMCKCNNTNIAEVILMCLKLSAKHSFTWTATLDIFRMLNFIFNKNLFPTTKYKINKLLKVNKDCIVNHILCTECNQYLGKSKDSNFQLTCPCGREVNSRSVGSSFIAINPVSQLQNLFSNQNIVNSLQERFNRKKISLNGLEDLFDGELYKKYSRNDDILGNPYNYSYTFNTDGCQAADSSKVTIWPIYMMIHEFPDYLRKKYMPLVGLWVSKTEPNMKVFLQPFVETANELSSKGFTWKLNGLEIVSRFFPLGCCVDSVARCALLNMKKFNGTHGCTYCEHSTVRIEGVRKYPMMEKVPQLRTDESIKRSMIEAYFNKMKDVMGVWGPSPLMNLKYFSITKGMVVDYMHSCLLGVTELHLTLLLSKVGTKYYVGSPAEIHVINKRLSSIKPPSCIAKLPRNILEKNLWTASEWLAWLILYSTICLKGILHKQFYEHWLFFVAAINILISDCIEVQMLRKAEILLIKFVFYFEKYYGKNYMYYNIHLLLHLVETVRNWGPLWANNTFPFENQNRLLLKLKKCNNRIAQQIVYKLLIYQQLPIVENEIFISNRIKTFCKDFSSNQVKIFDRVDNCILCGSGKIHSLSNKELDSVKSTLNIPEITKCTKYANLIYNSFRYSLLTSVNCKKKNDSVFQTDNDRYGLIKKICKIEYHSKCYVVIFYNELYAEKKFIENQDVSTDHLLYCTVKKQKDLQVINVTIIYRPCILMTFKNKIVIGKLSKGILNKHVN